jgi:hypothetical protein
MVASCDLQWVQRPVAVVAILTRPALAAPRRTLSQVAMASMFEGPFMRSHERNTFGIE